MITCTLGDKKYSVDFISGRALREMEPSMRLGFRSSASILVLTSMQSMMSMPSVCLLLQLLEV